VYRVRKCLLATPPKRQTRLRPTDRPRPPAEC
jgi:hypothetical protein